MSWVHPATLRPDSQAFRCTTRIQLFSTKMAKKKYLDAREENKGCYLQWRCSKNSSCRALSTKLSILKTHNHEIEQEYNTRFHLYEIADTPQCLMTHVRNYAVGREMALKTIWSIVSQINVCLMLLLCNNYKWIPMNSSLCILSVKIHDFRCTYVV